MSPSDPTASVLANVGITQSTVSELESSVIEGIGFTIGGVVFGLLLLWLGGESITKKVKRVLS